MLLSLIVMAAVAALFAAVVAWAMARRYGRRRALVVPVLAILAALFTVVRAVALEEGDAILRVSLAMGFAGPAVAGALAGLVLAGRK
jgi:phosphotransferase system  glucose/maltose/N-acetylglucosamine-specific IIC component